MAPLRSLPGWLAVPALFAAAFSLYWSGLRNPLLFDDSHLQEYFFRTRYAGAAFHMAPRWVSDASFGLVYAAFDYSIPAQRVFNMAAHAAVACALFAFAARLGGVVLHEARAGWRSPARCFSSPTLPRSTAPATSSSARRSWRRCSPSSR
jgi:hypothetical protein